MQSWFTHFVSGSISKNHLEEKKIYFKKCICRLPRLCGDDTAFREDTVRYKYVDNRQSQYQHFRLIGTQHLAHAACSLICSQCNNGHADCAKCCVRIKQKYWCCDQPIGEVLIAHRISPKGSAITAGWRLMTFTYFEIKIF